MFDLRGRVSALIMFVTCVVAAVPSRFLQSQPFLGGAVSSVSQQSAPASSATSSRYQTRFKHDPDGTGKFYLGREIAQVMGPGGIEWLERSQRDVEEHPAEVLDALDLHRGEVVVDLGAGSGYFTFRMTPKVDETGKVIAVDVQDEMLQSLRQRATATKVTNVEVVKGAEKDPHLPVGAVDLVLMVDVYHELEYPFEIMEKVRESLKSSGRVVFVEYRKEDPAVPIKEVHKMSVQQLEGEMNAVGFARERTVETLPLQHIVIFRKK
jgi:precorrin-6B methylase 2